MKGGQGEEKIMGPLFPRLHINDTEKGGPRAPPRNKMALYEQLSIPTQRYTSGGSSPTTLPLLHRSTGNMPPSTSSTLQMITYPPLCDTSTSHLAERLLSHTSAGAILNTSSTNRVGPCKVTSERDSGHLSVPAHFSYFQPPNYSNFRNSSGKRLRDDVECRVPALTQSENTINSVDRQRKKAKEEFGSTRISGLGLLKSTLDLSKHHVSAEGNARMPSNSVFENGDGLLEKRNGSADESRKCQQKYEVWRKSKAIGEGNKEDAENASIKSNACTLEGESCFRPSSPTDNKSHEKECGSLHLGRHEKNAAIAERCILDSISSVNISPDAVAELIGHKQFWKARRAIVHHQRLFAVQVFELHRLIKVQRLIAESPDILLADKIFTGKPSINALPEKKLCLDSAPEGAAVTAQKKDVPQITNLNADTNKGLNALLSNYKPYSAAEEKPSLPWCLPLPPGNQWLVPMMSPFEGLIYKPYTGPCPPTRSSVTPTLGNCGSTGLTPIGEDFLRFGFFPPYCIPSLNPSNSSSAVGQVNPLSKARPKANEEENNNHPRREEPYTKNPNLKTSINVSNGVNSYCMRNDIESKESEVHGSTASSPGAKLHEDALPLFPTAPTVQALDKSEKTQSTMNHTRVIKVVPHNPTSASESAARIFRSIQEERRQHE